MILRNVTVMRPKKTKIQRGPNGQPYVLLLTGEKRYNKKSRSYTEVRKNIGVMVDENYKETNNPLMYPNERFKDYFPEMASGFSKRSSLSPTVKIGFDMIADKILEERGLNKIIHTVYGDSADLIINVVKYIVVHETVVFQHYPSLMYNYPLLGGRAVSDSYISMFNNSQETYERTLMFYAEWNRTRTKEDIIWFSYDATNMNNQSRNLSYSEYGYPKIDVGTPQINLAVAMDLKERIPLFPELYSGSIPDVAQFRYMIDKAEDYGYSQFGILCDRGYFSRENVLYCDEHHLEFMFMLKGNLSVSKSAITQAAEKMEKAWETYLIEEHHVFGMTLTGQAFEGDAKERYFHVYFDGERNAASHLLIASSVREQEQQLTQMLQETHSYTARNLKAYQRRFHLSYDSNGYFCGFEKDTAAIQKEMKEAGYYCILSSVKMTAEEALSVYKDRDVSEKLFQIMKSELGYHAVSVSSDISLHNKTLMVFIATILRIYIHKGLSELRKSNRKDNTVNAVINYMQTLELTRNQRDIYTLSQPLTKRHREILQQFGISDSDLAAAVHSINERLKNSVGL